MQQLKSIHHCSLENEKYVQFHSAIIINATLFITYAGKQYCQSFVAGGFSYKRRLFLEENQRTAQMNQLERSHWLKTLRHLHFSRQGKITLLFSLTECMLASYLYLVFSHWHPGFRAFTLSRALNWVGAIEWTWRENYCSYRLYIWNSCFLCMYTQFNSIIYF